jgi:sugar lactone lactonase YvrE
VDPGTTVLLDGLTFPNHPRWHDGRLWFVDIPLTTRSALACMLGGPDRRTLFALGTSQGLSPEKAREKQSGRIEILQVDVPGAGLP